MEIRSATPAESDSILKLINTAFQVERFFKNQDRLDDAGLASHFKTGAFLVAEEEGRIAGCIYVEREPSGHAKTNGAEGSGDHAYFGLLSVDPSHQKSGVGRRLVAAAEEFARETGARFMDLKLIHLRTELPRIYQKLGYHVTGTEPYPAARAHMLTQPVHFICMTKELGRRQ